MSSTTHRVILSRIATIFGGIILGSLVYTTTAFALPPLIMEVQPVNVLSPDDPPDQLVVYGRHFGLISNGGVKDPDFTFGTGRVGIYNGYLAIAADQSMCPIPVDDSQPPLDDTIPGYECVVLDIPAEFYPLTPGDYLLEIRATGIQTRK